MPSQGNTTQRGYGFKHQKLRKQFEPHVKSGKATCWRCGISLDPNEQWDLGHVDDDKTKHMGPECIPCNRATSARRTTTYGPPVDTSRTW